MAFSPEVLGTYAFFVLTHPRLVVLLFGGDGHCVMVMLEVITGCRCYVVLVFPCGQRRRSAGSQKRGTTISTGLPHQFRLIPAVVVLSGELSTRRSSEAMDPAPSP